MLIHLLTPRGLSWTRNGVPKTSQAHDLLITEKLLARPEDLCHGLPVEFEDFLRSCRRLKFAELPDYDHWIQAFSDLAVANGYSGNEAFVWPPPAPSVSSSPFSVVGEISFAPTCMTEERVTAIPHASSCREHDISGDDGGYPRGIDQVEV
jgi:hypothetical protein